MKIVFWGSSEIGIPLLEKIKARFDLLSVVTAVDKPQGRHLKIIPGPIKKWAQKNNIRIFQPEKLTGNQEFYNELKKLKPDLFVVLSYGKIIPHSYLEIPEIAPLNIHPSLLPKFRGPAPLEWALIKGERETGITVILMDKNIDTGRILPQIKVKIDEKDDIFSLREKVSCLFFDCLIEAITKLLQGYTGEEQKGIVSYAPKLKKEDGKIKWNENALVIHNKIRGLADWPGAYTFLVYPQGKRMLKIKKSAVFSMENSGSEPGRFVDLNKKILVACGSGILSIEKLQEEGKKIQTAIEYLNGHHKILKESYLQW
ncbi:MAG: methionyl-tRNA formyltransferase [bacterium]|nr:methionyl-tRNA formyltransferase [bacterium]